MRRVDSVWAVLAVQGSGLFQLGHELSVMTHSRLGNPVKQNVDTLHCTRTSNSLTLTQRQNCQQRALQQRLRSDYCARAGQELSWLPATIPAQRTAVPAQAP